MSGTPRTDAAVQAYYDTGQSFSVVEPELARQLERELNEANADRLRLRAVLQSIDLSPCDGGSCQVATDADDYIQAALATTSAPAPVVAKADADALAEELYESMALNINVFSDADTETCSYYSEHKKVIKDAKAALETYHAKYPKS